MKKQGLICVFIFLLVAFGFYAFAQDNDKLTGLTKKIMEAKSTDGLYGYFEELSSQYFQELRYNELISFLESLGQKKNDAMPYINYYIALSRYKQIKYLEDSQNWNEYFANVNNYREQILASAQKAVDQTGPAQPVNIYARLILWRLHKDLEDGSVDEALSKLGDAVLSYSKTTSDPELIKDVADRLLSYGEKTKLRQLYKLYVEKMAAVTGNLDSLAVSAAGFFKEGNIDLSEAIYDVYILKSSEALTKKNLIPVITGIAEQFSFKGQGPKDMFYAEKLFKKIEELGGREAFGEDLLYERAFNLEKIKEYPQAKDVYIDLLNRFPKSAHADEIGYRIGLIMAYVQRDITQARNYFGKLAQGVTAEAVPGTSAIPAKKEPLAREAVLSLYQLGLLSQWQGDFVQAKEYYNKLIAAAGEGFTDRVNLTKQRLAEIGQGKPIEYNLKMFLDVSLKEENALFNMTRLDLNVSPAYAKKEEKIDVSATANIGETGCMQVVLTYLWSGDLGAAEPSTRTQTFETTYSEEGIKEINLVVVSPSGVVDRNISLIDIY